MTTHGSPPACPRGAQPTRGAGKSLPFPEPVGPHSLKRRIFVVEDHPLMREATIATLEREPDLSVCGYADDVAAALDAITSLHPDLVLTDINLKSSSGLDLIRSLRMATPDLPIIATTLFDIGKNERRARIAGASAFVPKQDGPEGLLDRIRKLAAAATRPHGIHTPRV